MKPDELAKLIGQRLLMAREEAGLSRAELGQRLGLSEAGYGHIESGRRLIGIEYLLQLPQILDKPLSYFLPDSAMDEAERAKLALDPGFREVMEAWPALDEEGRELLRRMARVARRGSRPALRLVAAEERADYAAGNLEGEIGELVRLYPKLGPIFDEAKATLPEHAVRALVYNIQIWIRQGVERDNFAKVHRKLGDVMA